MPETVQLIVEVAGLCSRAPALEIIRPAGIAPLRNAHKKRSYQASLFPLSSTSERALATRRYVASIVSSTGSPCLFFNRYFLSFLIFVFYFFIGF